MEVYPVCKCMFMYVCVCFVCGDINNFHLNVKVGQPQSGAT